MSELSINRGRVVVYRLFDAASYIDLSQMESMARERPARRLRLSKKPQVKALEFTNPPVSFELGEFDRSLLGAETKVTVTARAYDFGVLSISLSIPLPPGSTLTELEEASRNIVSDESVETKAMQYAVEVLDTFRGAITEPGIKEDFIEDYTVFFIESLAAGPGGGEGGKGGEGGGGGVEAELLEVYDPSRLLLYETDALSPGLRSETLKHRFSYHPDDLIILNYDNALVIEPSGNTDILDILEFANAQLLELRYYDGVLDKELNWVYSELARRGRVSLLRIRQYERLAMRMTEIVRDLTEVTEKVDNALKLTEDVYFARIYTAAMRLFRSSNWEQSIKEKIEIISNTCRMLHNEISIKRGHLLEATIVILIVIEIFLFLGGL